MHNDETGTVLSTFIGDCRGDVLAHKAFRFVHDLRCQALAFRQETINLEAR